VLDSLADMDRLNFLRVRRVSDGAGDLENPVIGPGTEAELGHGPVEILFGFRVNAAEFLHLPDGQPPIGGQRPSLNLIPDQRVLCGQTVGYPAKKPFALRAPSS